jgi:hypothetical protein
MDIYKAKMQSKCGVGGLFCSCCNDYKGKDKARLNRLTRRAVKRLDAKEAQI